MEKRKDYEHTAKSHLVKYIHWVNIIAEEDKEEPVCINWDYVDKWKEIFQVEINIVLLTPEQEQTKDVIGAKKKIWKIIKYMNQPFIGQKFVSTRVGGGRWW